MSFNHSFFPPIHCLVHLGLSSCPSLFLARCVFEPLLLRVVAILCSLLLLLLQPVPVRFFWRSHFRCARVARATPQAEGSVHPFLTPLFACMLARPPFSRKWRK